MKRAIPLTLALCGLTALPREAAADEYLHANEYLFHGQRLIAPHCYYQVAMQADGNLVVHGGSGTWASDTVGSGAYAVMQDDGNLVVYDWNGSPVWASDTWGHPGSYLAMQGDGNAVVYSSGGSPLWASDTWTTDPIGVTPCSYRSVTTKVEHGHDRPGGDYIGYYLEHPDPAHCAYFCSQDAACRAFTFVPPGVQAASAVCWLKSSAPGPVQAPGMVSGRIIRDGESAHDTCVTGEPLDPYCKRAMSICNADPYCCTVAWDSVCVQEVRTINNSLRCDEAKGACAHTLCTTGASLTAGCDSPPAASSCASSICAADPYCCNASWDEICVDEVATLCNKQCENAMTL